MSESLVLEHLRAIRADIADIKLDIRDVKHRVTALEIAVANLAATEAAITQASHLARTGQTTASTA